SYCVGFAGQVVKSRQVRRASLPVVGISLLFATITGDDDAAVAQPNAGVGPRPQVGVAPIAGVANELAGQRQPIAFGDATSTTNVPAGAVLVAGCRRLPGQFVQALDAFGRDAHTESSRESEMSVVSEDAAFYPAVTYRLV
ncbi:MAG: hypothetical protein ACI8TL_000566, partial [Natronomonas sp.]